MYFVLIVCFRTYVKFIMDLHVFLDIDSTLSCATAAVYTAENTVRMHYI